MARILARNVSKQWRLGIPAGDRVRGSLFVLPCAKLGKLAMLKWLHAHKVAIPVCAWLWAGESGQTHVVAWCHGVSRKSASSPQSYNAHASQEVGKFFGWKRVY